VTKTLGTLGMPDAAVKMMPGSMRWFYLSSLSQTRTSRSRAITSFWETSPA
jgi:hypothetical protein